MRRFTLEDGTSAKFWEVGRSGAQVTVRFGRLGTQGQTKLKDWDSAEAAAASVEKLVREKVGKGYSEELPDTSDSGAEVAATVVATEAPRSAEPATAASPSTVPASPAPADPAPASPAAAASPAPAAAPALPDEASPAADGWVAPDSWRQAGHPFRTLDPVPAPAPDPTPYDDLLAARRQQVRARLQDPQTEDDLRQAGLAALGEPSGLLGRTVSPVPTALGEAALAAALIAEGEWPETEQLATAVVDAWWQRLPGDLAAQAVVALSFLAPAEGERDAGVRRSTRPRGWHRNPSKPMQAHARLLLAGTDDAAYQRAVAGLERVVRSPDELALAAYLAPTRRDWVAAALDPAAPPLQRPFLRARLIASALTADEAAAAWAASPWDVLADRTLLLALAAHLGPAAVPVLLSALDEADTDTARWLGLVLTGLPSEQTFQGLLARMDRKGGPELVRAAAAVQTRRAARLLAERAAGTSGVARTCAALLRTHLLSHPAAVAVEAELAPGPRAALLAAVAVPDTRPVAGPDRLPAVLVQAPWERRGKAAAPTVVAGLANRLPTEVRWEPGERDRWRRRPGQWERFARDWDAALRDNESRRTTLLAVAPVAVGRRYLDLLPEFAHWSTPEDARGVLAQHEADAVPLLLDLVRTTPEMADVLLPVQSAEVALVMADWYTRTKTVRPLAAAWLARHPAAAALALVPAALGPAGRARRAAERVLRLLAAADPGVVEQAAAAYGEPAAGAVAAMLQVDPVEVLPARVPSLPAWLEPAALPSVLLADRSARLDLDALRRLLTCLALSEPGEPYAGLEQALPALEPTSVAACAWAVLEAWRLAGEPAKDGWVLTAQGLVGDDDTARQLGPLISAWPKQGGSSKATAGLEVLAAIGTDVALMHLHRISTRAPSRPLRDKAEALMQRVADDLRLTTEELADRLVPDLGLDPDGRTVLDYGPRQFVVGFDEALKPYVEEGGSRRAALPKPGGPNSRHPDDPELAPAAYARFTTLKKDVKVAAADALRRFERAMADQRRWAAGEQRRLLIDHPLLWHLTRRLVWTVFAADGQPQLAFRVAEDRTLADRDDHEVTVADDAAVGIAHPLHLGDDQGIWAELFADYEILQPFPQLGREVLRLTADERSGTSLTRFASAPVETARLYGLAARGWERGQALDAGIQSWLEKRLPGGLLAVVDLDPGIVVGAPEEFPEQRLTSVRVLHSDAYEYGRERDVRLAELDDVSASELLRDLTRVAG